MILATRSTSSSWREPTSVGFLIGGKHFWELIPFTMQMVMVLIGGYVVASAPIVYRGIQWMASLPRSPRAAIALIALFSMLSSLVSWGFSLVFSGILTREMSARVKGMDYRAAGAAAYLGLGAVWACGLSSSAALMMATRGAIPPKLMAISGLIPLSQSLFLWQSFVLAGALVGVSVWVAYASAPAPEHARTAEDYGIPYEEMDVDLGPRQRPGEWLEYSPLLTLLVVGILTWYLGYVFQSSSQGWLAALDLNTYNLIFITLGMLLHWSPKSFMRSVARSVPATAGVLIQFPFYAVIFGMIVSTAIEPFLARLFTLLTTHDTYPILVGIYSAVLGAFVPSGGSKWVIEAPYVLEAAREHQVHLGWVIQTYNASEALANLVNPFFMLPLLGVLRLKARDLVGFCFLQLIAHIPLVFFLCWVLARTLTYVPPVLH